MNPIVAVDGLRIEAGGRVLVDGVSLRVHPGRVTALLGASGSGKTTTGLALLGEYPEGARVSGSVRVPGGPLGHVPQHPASVLNPARRAGALLGDLARRSGQGRSEVRAALRAAQLPEPEAVLRRFPHQLSGGQQQRVVLAQALLLGARVIVADEPTTGLDPLTKARVVERLAAVVRQGVGLLLLSHDLDVVRALADEVVVLRAGRVVESGPAGQVLGQAGGDRPPGLPVPPPAAVRPPSGTAPAGVLTTGTAPTGTAPAGLLTADVLTVEQLTARHRDGPTVLHAAGLGVGAGECLALVGRSGSGKTTLGRCLAGLHSTYRGRVLLDGEPLPRSLRSRTRPQLAAVQYVFQDARASFDEHRPVAAQVARAARRLRGLGRAEADAAASRVLAELGLPAATAGRRPAALSGGELQRAALARAMVVRPKVLVCDEITSGLDGPTRGRVLDALARRLREADLAVLLITHDLAAADTIAGRTAVLEGGRLVGPGGAD
ncbi:ABC transporter ATP-binding protein [Kitasatospora indigofera]|uniref:ABC transporter ATP-binding protein n=1 Tax=Kitasatospora indigofera TaxID=67307 RepID=A0A919KST3_9ACTN|nr:ATP-binding cassette domain-containing protein [Kitasatospora indigofera]GHH71755.1 ABC transporter ATP-binding protein [Kitasatospora indigofera]